MATDRRSCMQANVSFVLRLCAAVVPMLVMKTVPAQDQREVTLADYERAERFMPYNTEPLVLRSVESPTWLTSGKFWYRTRGTGGREFVLVDPRKGVRGAAFDQDKVARLLSRATGEQYSAGKLPFNSFAWSTDERTLSFAAGAKRWRCHLSDDRCEELPALDPDEALSPDGKRAVFLRDDNLWLRDQATGAESQLTRDGTKDFGYATDNEGWRHGTRPVVLWSPDSKRIATFQQDQRGVGEMYTVTTKPGHPRLDTWKYPMSGDEVVPTLHRVIIDVGGARVVRLQMSPDARRSTAYYGIQRPNGELADAQWNADGSKLAFISLSRDYRRAQLRIADAVSGTVRDVFEERVPTFYESACASDKLNWRYLPATNEAIWYSSRSNWSHFYLYDLTTGKVKQQITQGDWNVVALLRVDERKRELYFTAVGREKGRDPYFEHLYKVRFDGTGLKLLTPEDATHDVSLAPSGDYFVDSYSKPDMPPVAVLRDRNGKLIRTLEKTDIARLDAIGWKPPMPITVKGRDGTTDLYGLMYRPTSFDATRKYPIINSIYPGPHGSSVGTRRFVTARGTEGDVQALAELGFIVVQIDGMGTALRSKAFHDTYYGNMADNTLPDQIAGMKELARRYPWIDVERTGIYGLSGGGYATVRAMFDHPEFFKAGVATNGNYDQRSYADNWSEHWMDPLERRPDGRSNYDTQASQSAAKNLQGHLLLVHSTMDDNVTLNIMMVVVDALVKANKNFDLLLLPNQTHGPTGDAARYLARRRWDYFIRHLQEIEPPKEFRMRGPAADTGAP